MRWHHEVRGCGYHGFSEADRCPCRLTDNQAVAALVERARADADYRCTSLTCYSHGATNRLLLERDAEIRRLRISNEGYQANPIDWHDGTT